MAKDIILQVDEHYEYGLQLHETLANDMPEGKLVMCAADVGILTQMICASEGDHLEIGSAYGGSAIVAFKAMEHCGRDGKVVCIDPYDKIKQKTVHSRLKNKFWSNVGAMGGRGSIELVQEFSHPFPLDENARFGSALIDGSHSVDYVKNDWLNIKDIVECYIMFHDYVITTVRKAIYEWVLPDEDWLITHVCGWSLVMKNIKC